MAFYKQLKVSVEPDLAQSFKVACINAGVSMASEFSEFMAVRTGTLAEFSAKKANQVSYDTRRKRRQHINAIIGHLEAIRDSEDAYRAKIPDNLQSGSAYADAVHAIVNLSQAIELLKNTY